MELNSAYRMPSLVWLLFSIPVIVNTSVFAQSLDHDSPPTNNAEQIITFFMNDVLRSSHSSGPLTGNNGRLPPRKPVGQSPTACGVPNHDPSASQPGPSVSWLPSFASPQGLEPGKITMIEEELTGSVIHGPPLRGKVQGIYVTGLENGGMVAMKATFTDGEAEDSLRFFGLHHPGHPESHIAVIGGTGRYHDTNGFAVVKAVHPDSAMNKILLLTVYLK